MKKLLGIMMLLFILFNTSLNAKQTKWKRGQIYENEVTWLKNSKHSLPVGEKFRLIMSSHWSSWGITINGKLLVSTKGNLFHQSLSLDKLGSTRYLAYLKVMYEEIFFLNKYDGCYPRPEYTVMKRRRGGGFFNCFIVRHHDVQKVFYSPDDPQRSSGEIKYAIKKYEIEFPRIIVCSEHLFYAPSIAETVMSVEFCMNPETNGASKNEYFTEESSEYHPQNINKYPDKKKFMEKFIKETAKRHKRFEKDIKAKEKHKLDLSEYGVGEIVEEIKTKVTTTNINSNGGIAVEIKELYELYKEGVLTKEQFEKAKKKLLN